MINQAEKIKQVWIWIWLIEKKGDLIEFKQPEEENLIAICELSRRFQMKSKKHEMQNIKSI